MIITFIINIFYGIASMLLSLLPTMAILPNDWTEAWNYLSERIGYILYLTPVSETIISILGIFILFEGALFTFNIIDKIYSWIPGKMS